MEITEQQIRTRAHQLWELAGKPDGKDAQFWHEAERELKSPKPDQQKPDQKTLDKAEPRLE
jgi:hypothetical protein